MFLFFERSEKATKIWDLCVEIHLPGGWHATARKTHQKRIINNWKYNCLICKLLGNKPRIDKRTIKTCATTHFSDCCVCVNCSPKRNVQFSRLFTFSVFHFGANNNKKGRQCLLGMSYFTRFTFFVCFSFGLIFVYTKLHKFHNFESRVKSKLKTIHSPKATVWSGEKKRKKTTKIYDLEWK
jgi:hypothetical protein